MKRYRTGSQEVAGSIPVSSTRLFPLIFSCINGLDGILTILRV